MCLYNPEKPTKKWGIGYKSVKKEDDIYVSYDYIRNRGFKYGKIGDVVIDPNEKEIGTYHSYPAGFHVMLNKEACIALNQPVIKVRYSKATAEEKDTYPYGDVVVAKKIKILEEITSNVGSA